MTVKRRRELPMKIGVVALAILVSAAVVDHSHLRLFTGSAAAADASETATTEPVLENPAKPADAEKKPEEKSKQDASESESDKDDKDDKDADSKTYTVRSRPFSVDVEFEATLEAVTMTPVLIDPKEWSEWTVVKAVAAGSRVNVGDELVEFDARKLDEQIADIEADRELETLQLSLTQEEIRLLEKENPLELAANELQLRHAEQDLSYFRETGRPNTERTVRFQGEQIKQFLEYAQEELKQLEKMYQADDLTEETEEIILKRQRNEVESVRFFVEMTKIESEHILGTVLPRRETELSESLRRAQLAHDRVTTTLPLQLNRRRMELEKTRHEEKKTLERLAKLREDRKSMSLRSPAAGVVYYGKSTRGKWSDTDAVGEQLRRHGSVSPREVFMTIVEPRPLVVRGKAEESRRMWLRPGLAGTFAPTALPGRRFGVVVEAVAPIPSSDGHFDVTFAVQIPEGISELVPGLNGKILLRPYQNSSALTVPAAAVFDDPSDPNLQFVYVVDEKGSHTRRPVQVGRRDEERIEIVEGLKAGDKILREDPESTDNDEDE